MSEQLRYRQIFINERTRWILSNYVSRENQLRSDMEPSTSIDDLARRIMDDWFDKNCSGLIDLWEQRQRIDQQARQPKIG